TTSPASATIGAGQSTTFVVTVAPQGGPFRSAVTLSCGNANLPPQTACTFNPSTVTPGSGSAQSTLTISTTASSMVGPGPLDRVTPLSSGPSSRWPMGFLFLMGMAVAVGVAYTTTRQPGVPFRGGQIRALAAVAAAALLVTSVGETIARSASMEASGI